MTREVFISYSSKNVDAATAVCTALEEAGHSCWIAVRDLTPGMEWAEAIVEAIASCRVMVVVFSSHCNASPQVLREASLAVDCRRDVVVMRIENALPERGLKYYFGASHWMDACSPPFDARVRELVGLLPEVLSGKVRAGGHRRRTWPRKAVAAAFAVALLASGVGFWIHSLPAPPPPLEDPAVTDTLPAEVTLSLGSGTELDLVLVKAGDFHMGSTDAEANEDERPVHRVRLARSYYIGKYPVTVSQFRRFVTASAHRTTAEEEGLGYSLMDQRFNNVPGRDWRSPGFLQDDDHPVVLVSLEDAEQFAAWASLQTRRTVRLPTENEWEYAARGPESLRYPWGNAWNGALVNHADLTLKQSAPFPEEWRFSHDTDGHAFTSPVGTLENASWCGARDACGNVWQWCSDVYRKEGYGRGDFPPGSERRNESSTPFVIRGGSWSDVPAYCRPSARYWKTSGFRSAYLGFRVVMEAGPGTSTEP